MVISSTLGVSSVKANTRLLFIYLSLFCSFTGVTYVEWNLLKINASDFHLLSLFVQCDHLMVHGLCASGHRMAMSRTLLSWCRRRNRNALLLLLLLRMFQCTLAAPILNQGDYILGREMKATHRRNAIGCQ